MSRTDPMKLCMAREMNDRGRSWSEPKVTDDDRRRAAIRRRIEDILQAAELERGPLSEVWE